MNFPCVITIRDCVINETKSFSKDNVFDAEQYFINKIKENKWYWDEYCKKYSENTEEELIDSCIEDGYFDYPSGSVCLTWIDIPVVNN